MLLVGCLLGAWLVSARPAVADPVAVPVSCAPSGALTPTGRVTVQVPILGAVNIPFPALGQPIADALADTDLDLVIPLDIDATPEIAPGGTIDYSTSVSLDAGTVLQDVVDVVRQGIAAAGFEQLADTLQLDADFEDLALRFAHPEGTSASGMPTVSGSTPASASHQTDAFVLTVDAFTISTRAGIDPLSLSVAWSVADGGTVPPATVVQTLDEVTFDLAIGVEGTLPAELVELLLADVLPVPVTGDLPVAAGATGAWACSPNAGNVVATTSVVAEAAAAISGTVTGPDGPAAGVLVSAFAPHHLWIGGNTTITGADGSFELFDVAPGTYHMLFADRSGAGFLLQWWGGAPTRGASTPVTISSEQPVAGVDAHMVPGTTFAGTVSGPPEVVAGATVYAYTSGDRFVGSANATVAGDGSFVTSAVSAGDYRFLVIPPAGAGLPAFWSGGATRAQATAVAADGVTPAVGLVLQPPG